MRGIVLTNEKGAILELSGRQTGLMVNADLSGLAISRQYCLARSMRFATTGQASTTFAYPRRPGAASVRTPPLDRALTEASTSDCPAATAAGVAASVATVFAASTILLFCDCGFRELILPAAFRFAILLPDFVADFSRAVFAISQFDLNIRAVWRLN